MNIKQAKEHIQQDINAYRQKNAFGSMAIPVERQRPIFLVGAPGIGKTAIMEQIAQELNIGLVSYSMTHHTRQSALGLPFIVHKNYSGIECDVSEYTMSEIISSVYEYMGKYGINEGILFLDEINCVSETLAPSMLQFLQYKTFGRHRVPDGWIVVTAGNPPEYNNSVREFDIVTWDRLKRIDVEPDFGAWKEYAITNEVHPSILSYLEMKNDDFYSIETTIDGKQFVTARGWVDLSEMIKLYEHLNYTVDQALIRQYIQNDKIAKSFSAYYDLFIKYRGEYDIEAILCGTQSEALASNARKSSFDERLSLVSLLVDAVKDTIHQAIIQEDRMILLMSKLRELKEEILNENGGSAAKLLDDSANQLIQLTKNNIASKSIKTEKASTNISVANTMNEISRAIQLAHPKTGKDAFSIIRDMFNIENTELKEKVEKGKIYLDNMFSFCEKVFLEGQETLIIVTELSLYPPAARFIGKYGCKAYSHHSKNLMFYERKTEILHQIQELNFNI